jgi:hypothetical protein
MRPIWRRLKWTAAVTAIVAISFAATQVERGMKLGLYYRELGSKQAHLSPLERVLFTVLLVTKDQLSKQKRQA